MDTYRVIVGYLLGLARIMFTVGTEPTAEVAR
jgi:hypothetical protein